MTALAHDTKANYRPDIDGLRAIAVLAVVLFHIDANLIPGGFAGVDVFFVISGFLITGNIIKDAGSAQGFSWGEFYRRRALRILPVLFVVLLATLLVGHFVLLPEDLSALSYSSLAAIFSAANVYFTYFLDVSYFADDSNLQPLLHLWSLGVEEQFYLFWPVILLALLTRFTRRWLLSATLLLMFASFVLAEVLIPKEPMFAYYMLPARAGELMVGALLAIWLSRGHAVMDNWARLLLGLAGAGLITVSMGWITENIGFPGVNALPSTLGAALLIWAGSGRGMGVSRLLALRPLVLVGLISYSLYLWHWPVLAFYRYVYGGVEPLAGILLFGLMLLLSVVSYRWVEKPCRRLRWSFSKVMWRLVAINAAALLLLCGAILWSDGFGLYGFDAQYQADIKRLSPAPAAYSYPYVCQRPRLSEAELQSKACIVNAERAPSVLLWGDSNAAHYVGMLGAFAEASGFAFRNAAHSSCPPLLQGAASTQKPERLEHCLASIDVVRQHLGGYSTVILGAAWAVHARRSDSFFEDLEATVDELVGQGKQVIILANVPNFLAVNRKCLQKAFKLPVLTCNESSAERPGVLPINARLSALAAARDNVHFFDPRGQLCPEGRCSAYLDGRLVYFDASHLSMEGSWALGLQVVREQGVPDFFARLGGGILATGARPLDEALLERGKATFNVPVKSWSSLMLGEKWRGNTRREKRAEGIYLADLSTEAFSVSRYSFAEDELLQLQQGAPIRMQLTLTSCSDALPLLRLKARQGERESQYDVMLDCTSAQLAKRGESGTFEADVSVAAGEWKLQAQYTLPGGTDALEVSIYPSVGKVLGRYDATAQGAVVIHHIAWAIAPTKD
ncbi:acyltransferase family protein [Pseudomonas sp. Gutcm_11s]|uniref:acyltransferase family protein n=1 Tax=Pseudomonas sp. Gutcm_11s TaxID=3026088 RepID=UPI00235F3C85|nr:acyltransferase family protein [Pseudomonas sp. Gutcm_11s]MDD0842197.1 acyltransferase family protein [Pseudomonas sp. Gutcm_11s]